MHRDHHPGLIIFDISFAVRLNGISSCCQLSITITLQLR